MDGWDWEDITVETGEWWLFLLGLALLLAGLAAGYAIGRQAERKEWQRRRPVPLDQGPLP
jgi:hypothetical protein